MQVVHFQTYQAEQARQRQGEERYGYATISVKCRDWGQYVRAIRRRQGWTQLRLALSVHVDQPTVARYEAGVLGCDYATACAIADALGDKQIERFATQLVLNCLRMPKDADVAILGRAADGARRKTGSGWSPEPAPMKQVVTSSIARPAVSAEEAV